MARLDPHNGRPYRWIGWFFAKDYDGKLPEAIEACQEAWRRNLRPTQRAEVVKELAGALVDRPADYEAALETLARYPAFADQPEKPYEDGSQAWATGNSRSASVIVRVEQPIVSFHHVVQ